MFVINHAYQLKIVDLWFNDLTRVSGTRRLVVTKCLVIFDGQTFTNIKYIDISTGLNTGEATFTFTKNDDSTFVIRETDVQQLLYESLVITFLFQNESSTIIPEIDAIAEEVFTGTHGDLPVKLTGAKLSYNGVEYDDYGNTVPLILDDNLFTITAKTGFSIVNPVTLSIYVTIYFRVAPHKVIRYDVTSLVNIESFSDRIEITVPFILPLGTTTPFSDIQIDLYNLADLLSVDADQLTDYTINDMSTGTIVSPTYNTNSGELTFKPTDTDYRFTNDSIQSFKDYIKAKNCCKEVSITLDNGTLLVNLKNMYNNITFDNDIDLKLALNPYIDYGTIEHFSVGMGSTRLETGEDSFEDDITPDDGYYIKDVKVVGNYDSFSFENGTLTITGITGDCAITVDVRPLATIRLTYGNTVVDTIENIRPELTDVSFWRSNTSDNEPYILYFNNTERSYTLTPRQEYEIVGIGVNGVPSLILNAPQITSLDLSEYVDSNNTINLEVLEQNIHTNEDFTLNLYKFDGEKSLVDKTNKLGLISQITGTLRDSCSVLNPVIKIEYSYPPDFNYVYIPNFKRYYFVTDVVSISKNIWVVSLHVDVLMTYRYAIKSQKCLVARNENRYDLKLKDNLLVMEPSYRYEVISLDSRYSHIFATEPDNDHMSYVVQIIGG